MKIRLLITDDHRVVREGLGAILKTKAGIDLVGEATHGLEATQMAVDLKPDVILMDISMPKMNGILATQLIKAKSPEIGIIALTMHDDDATIFELIRAGVDGYLLKDADSDTIVNAIMTVHRGESIIDPQITKKILSELRQQRPRRRSENPRENKYHLSHREIEVLKKVAGGKSNKEIANELDLSEKTIKNHLHNIFSKMKVDDRTKAALKGIQEGIIDLDDSLAQLP
ncbi:Two-component transcriptional response regulator, LuxR family [hydrothermal vent metagenome]|uniref:Two-component transcriptional response regulator, LuxR family n=1 Tax=hydrothermal vent metagenome TaxID=652676 RepID=A0A3B1D6M4_9ZZZZ